MVTETDLALSGGRTLHVYDTAGDGGEDRLTVFWHHGTPNLGPPPEPLFPAADRLGIRWSYDRPGWDRVEPSSHGRWLAGRIPSASCGDARRTATSRSSARPRRPLAGSGSTQAWG